MSRVRGAGDLNETRSSNEEGTDAVGVSEELSVATGAMRDSNVALLRLAKGALGTSAGSAASRSAAAAD